jgi:hypothetical protein
MSRSHSQKGRHMSRTRTRTGTLAILLTCAVAGALLTAGPASAASRGFKLHNHSKHALRLEHATQLPRVLCNSVLCVPTHYPIDFEGRPHDGAVLHPGGSHAWELKYGFNLILLHETQYAAVLKYKIEGTDGTVEYTIQTTPTSNDSACKVVPAHVGHCTAGGLALTFKNH